MKKLAEREDVFEIISFFALKKIKIYNWSKYFD